MLDYVSNKDKLSKQISPRPIENDKATKLKVLSSKA